MCCYFKEGEVSELENKPSKYGLILFGLPQKYNEMASGLIPNYSI